MIWQKNKTKPNFLFGSDQFFSLNSLTYIPTSTSDVSEMCDDDPLIISNKLLRY